MRYKSPVQAYALGFCESADRIEVLAVHDAGEQACPSGVRHQYKRPPRTVCLSG
ncbi:hypothetical protein [Saccharothrix sp.]|uniref:hypothetical protein n=1 Tax=Saccharothrix sp. TaxID=1873460 RepID=UPI0028110EC2|nr:hypothetical protein [Saccharothrix sp.]